MRITNSMLTSNFLADMQNNLANMQKLQTQMTSGKVVNRPSDDPIIAARSIEINSEMDANTQYNSNIKDTTNWLNTTDTALGQIGNDLSRIKTLLISAGDAGYSDQEKQSIKAEINQRVSQLSQTLNTNFDGKYIFGGTRGTTQPTTVATVTSTTNTSVTTTISSGTQTVVTDVTTSVKEPTPRLTIPTPITSPSTTVTSTTAATDKATGNITTYTVYGDGTATSETKDSSGTVVTATAPIAAASIPTTSSPTISKLVITDGTGTTTSTTSETTTSSVTTAADSGPTTITSTATHNNTVLEYNRSDGSPLDTSAATGTTDGNELSMVKQKLVTEVSQGVTMAYSVSASDIINYPDSKTGAKQDLRDLLKSIVNHLDGNNADGSAADANSSGELVNQDLQGISDATDNLLKIRANVGAYENRMTDAQDNNESETQNLTTILSKTEDIDITQKTMEYATAQTVYLASLQTGAKVIQPSLLDYLR